LRQPPSPQRTFKFERRLQRLLDDLGRAIVEWTYNASEPVDIATLPARLRRGTDEYRRNRKTPRQVATLFGPITLRRCVYQAVAAGMPGVFPLEHALGIVAHAAAPALADTVGRLAADLTQQQALDVLAERHGVHWSVGTLRKVTSALAEVFAPLRQAAQVAQLVSWLKKAAKSRGKFRPTLAVGRDGVMVPLRPFWEEASTATVSVLDRRGKRLGTVYLGRMPEPGQGALTDQLTQLLQAVLAAWLGALPRLIYITDAGSHPQKYFRYQLRRMKHPRTGRQLSWQWLVDYFHACEYVGKLSEALFGVGRDAAAWAAKMRRVLKEDRGGITRVLYSARALRARRGLAGCRKDFKRAMNYLRKYRRHMNYADCRRSKLPIGSGVTEAACKTIFGYRFKQSGMRWKLGQSQHVLDLRVILKSNVWEAVRNAWLRGWQPLKTSTGDPQPTKTRPKPREYLLPA
jgi:hypothetical protein